MRGTNIYSSCYREEAMAYRNELERVNAMLQEAKEATAQAVQMTMNEVRFPFLYEYVSFLGYERT